MGSTESDRRHHWADVVAIVAGVVSIGFAIWGVPLRLDDAGENVGWVWGVYAAAGVLALLAVVVAQRSAGPARLLLAFGGLALLIAPVAVGGAVTTWIANAIVGGAMLVAAPFVGYLAPDLPPGRPPR